MKEIRETIKRKEYLCPFKNQKVVISSHYHGLTKDHLYDSCDNQVILNCYENCKYRNN